MVGQTATGSTVARITSPHPQYDRIMMGGLGIAIRHDTLGDAQATPPLPARPRDTERPSTANAPVKPLPANQVYHSTLEGRHTITTLRCASTGITGELGAHAAGALVTDTSNPREPGAHACGALVTCTGSSCSQRVRVGACRLSRRDPAPVHLVYGCGERVTAVAQPAQTPDHTSQVGHYARLRDTPHLTT